jgi:hypothetical protein
MESLQWNNYTTILTGTTSSRISYQLRDIYSIYRYCWNVVLTERYIYSIYRCCRNVATYKWKVYNGTIILLSWQEPQALEYRIIWEIYTLYTGTAGMLLHINGKFTIEQLYYWPDRNHKLCNILSIQRYILYIQVLLECWYI